MNAAITAYLERLEFEALDAVVGFYDGNTSAEQVHIARQQLRHVRKFASSPELAQRELFAFRRPTCQSPAVAGH